MVLGLIKQRISPLNIHVEDLSRTLAYKLNEIVPDVKDKKIRLSYKLENTWSTAPIDHY